MLVFEKYVKNTHLDACGLNQSARPRVSKNLNKLINGLKNLPLKMLILHQTVNLNKDVFLEEIDEERATNGQI